MLRAKEVSALRALSQRPQTPVLFRSLPSLLFRPCDIQISVLPKPLACSDPSAPQTPGLFRFDPQTPGVSLISILLRLFNPKLAKSFLTPEATTGSSDFEGAVACKPSLL